MENEIGVTVIAYESACVYCISASGNYFTFENTVSNGEIGHRFGEVVFRNVVGVTKDSANCYDTLSAYRNLSTET